MLPLATLDLETTGLDSVKDAILEIGIVRLNKDGTRDTFASLVNPGRLVPPEITALTGITNDMVKDAPPLSAVLHEAADFIGELPVVGHNVGFDLGFMNQRGVLTDNISVDTYDIAAVLLPTTRRYNLATLALELGVEQPSAHRALADALTTAEVLLILHKKALALPLHLLAEIVQSGLKVAWNGQWFFAQTLRARSKEGIPARSAKETDFGVLFGKPGDLLAPPLKTNPVLEPLDEDEIAAALEAGGVFSKFLSKFESRPEQVEMTRAVTRALSTGGHMFIEAGTGIGKSFAYLVPAANWAVRNNARVVISTNTINLQDQLIKKDIPDMCAALGLELRSAVLKGRSNYLCPRRLQALRHRNPGDADEMRVLGKVLVWLEEGGNGDRGEINLAGPGEREVWSRLSAEDESCSADVCLNRMGGVCPYFRAHQAAHSAHILVVNHALLLADVVSNSRVLPDYDYLIVDEAHHMEAASTSALSYRISRVDLERLFDELGGINHGALGRLMSAVSTRLKPSDAAAFTETARQITDMAFRAQQGLKPFFQTIETFLDDEREGSGNPEYDQQVRIQPATRTQSVWSEVEIAWDRAAQPLDGMLRKLQTLQRSLGDGDLAEQEDVSEASGDLSGIQRRLGEAHTRLGQLVSEADENFIYWIERDPKYGRLTVNVAPLHIGPLMEKYVWHEKASVILTSATLTAAGEFTYLRSRLNADEADELALGSPFDYENAALLFIPTDMPEPSDYSQHQKWVERALVQLAKATGGQMLVLFTSYKQLKQTSRVIAPIMASMNIQVFEQGEGASSSALLETFRTTERAVLLGTRAFWEGVDIPGQALSALVIVKLPFDVPSDPVIAARSETFENPFGEYMLPEAILRFRQGFGRLIRTQSDRGIVAILDRRVRSKQYGAQFIQSLPTCTLVEKSIAELADTAKRWLNL